MGISPLDNWILEHTGAREAGALRDYQSRKLRETLAHASGNSRFYRKHLSSVDLEYFSGLDDLSSLPFTTAGMLAGDPLGFACVAPGEISRIVTLPTTGSTGPPKRVFFTEGDLELTIDFFHHGMTTLARPGDRVMIFLPGSSPMGVGDLLRRGLDRFGCEGVIYGPVYDYTDAGRSLATSGAACAVGLPSQMFALCRLCPDIRLKSVLLCSDYINGAVKSALAEHWGCEVFGHYGLTESGLGGGVDCSAHAGYHLREADLLFEIIDPVTGASLPDGDYGEVVFTTLTRRGAPLIRYRTGDIASMSTEPCPCGSAHRRLNSVRERIGGAVDIRGFGVTSPMLDDAIFLLERIIGFSAEVISRGSVDTLVLYIFESDKGRSIEEAEELLKNDKRLGPLFKDGLAGLEVISCGEEVLTYGNTKRRIIDKRHNTAI